MCRVRRCAATGNMQNCPRQLAMQSCALCGSSNQIKILKKDKNNNPKRKLTFERPIDIITTGKIKPLIRYPKYDDIVLSVLFLYTL